MVSATFQINSLRSLQVTPGHVQAYRIAPDVAHGVGRLDVAATDADRHHQFDLVVQVGGQRRVSHLADHAVGDRQHRVARLEKEERRLTAGKTHFLGMLGIVAADTVDAADRKHATTEDRHGGLGRHRDDVVHGGWSK